MAKKIRFPLEMEQGVEVRSMEELRENFSLSRVLVYLSNGKLVTWLRDRYANDIANAIEGLNTEDDELPKKVCEIFEIEYDEEVAINDIYDGMLEYLKELIPEVEDLMEDYDACIYCRIINYFDIMISTLESSKGDDGDLKKLKDTIAVVEETKKDIVNDHNREITKEKISDIYDGMLEYLKELIEDSYDGMLEYLEELIEEVDDLTEDYDSYYGYWISICYFKIAISTFESSKGDDGDLKKLKDTIAVVEETKKNIVTDHNRKITKEKISDSYDEMTEYFKELIAEVEELIEDYGSYGYYEFVERFKHIASGLESMNGDDEDVEGLKGLIELLEENKGNIVHMHSRKIIKEKISDSYDGMLEYLKELIDDVEFFIEDYDSYYGIMEPFNSIISVAESSKGDDGDLENLKNVITQVETLEMKWMLEINSTKVN